MLRPSLLALLALTTQAFADQSLPPQSQNFTYGAPENTQTDSFGRNTAGWLQAPAWGTQNGNRQGYLATPGNADTKGFLNTPGSNMVGDKGFLATPGAVRPGDTTGYLPTPGAQRGQSDTMVATTDDGKTVEMFIQAWGGRNLGPYLVPRWSVVEGDPKQTLWDDTGGPTSTWTVQHGVRDRDLPSPHSAIPTPHQPDSLYDRTRPERPGGAVYFEPFGRTNGGVTNPNDPYKHENDNRAKTNKAPTWVSELSRAGGNWLWGQPVVIDGDTFMLEGWPIRLAGIDAPEIDQLCAKGNIAIACGTESASTLSFTIEHQPVACKVHYTDLAGRLVSTCHTDDFELNATLIARGLAFPWQDGPHPYEGMAIDARDGQVGFWGLSFQHPAEWRAAQIERTQNPAPVAAAPAREDHSKPFPFIPFGKAPKKRMGTYYNAPSAQP